LASVVPDEAEPDEDSEPEEDEEPEDESLSEASEEAAAAAERPRPPTPSLSRFVMVFLFLLGFWAIVDRSLALFFGNAAGVVLWPVIGFNGALPVLTILLAGVLTTTISSVLRDYLTDWVNMARTQKILRALQRERLDAVRKGSQSRIKALQEYQASISKDLMDVQFAPMKSMALTMFMFIVLFTWLSVLVYEHLVPLGNQWIAVPWSANTDLVSVYVFPSWILLYSLLAIPFGQIVARVLKFIRFRRRLDEMGVPLEADASDAA
jgi:uncharacterized membrane protein (DUF106 family)